MLLQDLWIVWVPGAQRLSTCVAPFETIPAKMAEPNLALAPRRPGYVPLGNRLAAWCRHQTWIMQVFTAPRDVILFA